MDSNDSRIEHDIEDELEIAMFVTQRRIYDVLMGIYSNINPGEAEDLVKLHADGIFVTPPPAFRVEDE